MVFLHQCRVGAGIACAKELTKNLPDESQNYTEYNEPSKNQNNFAEPGGSLIQAVQRESCKREIENRHLEYLPTMGQARVG